MSRLILVPQLPVSLRYQEWWFDEFPKNFKKYFDVVEVLGESFIKENKFKTDNEMFSTVSNSIELEHIQIQQFLNMKVNNNDRLLLCDISFPGIFSDILYHKPLEHCYAICHASSKNAYDYFQSTRKLKWKNETIHSKLFKKVFVATNFHMRKLGWNNIKVVGLPKPPFKTYKLSKKRNIISVARQCIQKVSIKKENKIERIFGKINREKFNNWTNYYKYISSSKIMLITSKIETFGYQVLDAVLNNTVPIAPNKFSFPELLPERYLYNDYNDLIRTIELGLTSELKPELLNYSIISNFYKNVSNIMLNK